MKPSDIIICHGKVYGIVLDLDCSDLETEGYNWIQILWPDGEITWEDLILNLEDGITEVISESR